MTDAAKALVVRVLSAGLTFGLQILLARLMPLDSYGGFVAVWTWLLALGSFAALGLAESSLRFLPRYEALGRNDLVQAYWRHGFIKVLLVSITVTVLATSLAVLSGAGDGPWLIVLLVALGLPFLAVEYYLEGVARSFGWFGLATVPVYILRPVLIGALCFSLALAGVDLTLPVVGAVLVSAMAIVAVGVALVIARRLSVGRSPNASPKRRRLWLRAALPLLVVSGLDDLVSYADILVLTVMATPQDVGVYFAAARALALANFVAYAAYLVSGRRFALDLAARDRMELQRSILTASRLTFWSTLVAVGATLAVGPLLLAAFGSSFGEGYVVMVVLGLGLVAKSLAGQAGELLVVTGRQREAIGVTGGLLALTMGLCIALVPAFGILGAAIATALTMSVRSVALILTVWRTERLRVLAVGLPLG